MPEAMTPSDPILSSICAIVVAYRPDAPRLIRLLAGLSGQCDAVFIMDNGGADRIGTGAAPRNVHRIDMRGNRGIGAALNHGFRLAQSHGAKHVATFDQDSDPPTDLIRRLQAAALDLASRGIRVAAVGPRIVDARRGKRIDYPFMRTSRGWPRARVCKAGGELLEVDYLVTSGCLFDLSAYFSIGEFDPSLFVDCTDMEWCFRARARGHRLFGICAAVMHHEIGGGDARKVMGLGISDHSPVRRYYYARNTMRLIRMRVVPSSWKIRMLLGLFGRAALLPFAQRFAAGWSHSWKMLLRGVTDGVAGVAGPYPH